MVILFHTCYKKKKKISGQLLANGNNDDNVMFYLWMQDDLPPEQISVLRKAFDAFDRERSGSIPTDMVADILRLMGQPFNKKILDELIEEVDADSMY